MVKPRLREKYHAHQTEREFLCGFECPVNAALTFITWATKLIYGIGEYFKFMLVVIAYQFLLL